MKNGVAARLERDVIRAGICTGCGACVALDATGTSRMEDTSCGPLPRFDATTTLPDLAWIACPGKGINMPRLYHDVYGQLPDNWLLGRFEAVRTGYSANEAIRRNGASGGVMTHVLIHLLETGRIDAAIVARQGMPEPEKARAVQAKTRDEIMAAAQSVYIPVSMLDILRTLEPGKRYAMTCLPDQSAALRVLQQAGHPAARQIHYVLGPYTGTALYPAAIECYLRSKGVRPGTDRIASLRWRAGDWPGYLDIRMASGRVFQSKKFYYNFLIPFFITQASLQGMDFTNEFADLAVGDAWSPRFETLGGGRSVILARTPDMEGIIREMEVGGLLATAAEDPLMAADMHGHMLDFKKRGSYIRNRFRRLTGRRAPDFGLRPAPLPVLRIALEMVILLLFLAGGTTVARWLVAHIPERVIGPMFDRLRLAWKSASKPAKRKGLRGLKMEVSGNGN